MQFDDFFHLWAWCNSSRKNALEENRMIVQLKSEQNEKNIELKSNELKF